LIQRGVPTLFLAQAWFWKDPENRPKPGPARLMIWQKVPEEGWQSVKLEDSDSNVFHKAIPYDGSLITIGAEGAMLKKWTPTEVTEDNKSGWTSETLWEKSWGGKYDRLRDLEIGDVDGDGKDEFVIASHDAGVVAVYNPPDAEGGEAEVIELDQQADIFVHEIEIGDIDGDGQKEFFATPTGRNKANSSQSGQMVMYRWDGEAYKKTLVDPFGKTHAKEILVTDIDGDGKSELFSVVEAEASGPSITKPVEIRQYTLSEDGTLFSYTVIGTIQDRQTRFLVPGDFDQDGKQELVAAAMRSGLWLFDSQEDAKGKSDEEHTPWKKTQIDPISSGFEHTTLAADLDGDGVLELYVAADDQRELKKYTWNTEKKNFDKKLIGRLKPDTITWNITAATF
ncbi:MAG: FG-GAP-like repeat-containing protein, partial [Myxococcota bacterium]